MNENNLEICVEIMAIFREQGVEVHFAFYDGLHHCRLSFDDRVLFEDSNAETLLDTFRTWCGDLEKDVLGKYIAPA